MHCITLLLPNTVRLPCRWLICWHYMDGSVKAMQIGIQKARPLHLMQLADSHEKITFLLLWILFEALQFVAVTDLLFAKLEMFYLFLSYYFAEFKVLKWSFLSTSSSAQCSVSLMKTVATFLDSVFVLKVGVGLRMRCFVLFFFDQRPKEKQNQL